MKREPVQSSALQSIGYDKQHKILELEFRDNGGVWQYLKLPPAFYKKFRQAESLGRFFVKKIKGKYEEVRVA
ncbi:KTSC domain-containing protein [Mucilaginibacter limnophilus]|uniref:KTSC domain-containing protein n=1 Tax=Mucilaginibacter limnophilus TaxID=1932778 RepID=A0A3S2UMJ9_9SPHI|nr:KTSC domain-containing protein [Mucilaginibacter limnophilus]RVU02030.1 KTSC domain-containing protein [Mucilaginibacter limnophilus]